MTRVIAIGILSIGSLAASAASAAVLSPTHDTYLNRNAVSTNYGSDTALFVANDGGSAVSKTKDRYAVLRFDVSTAPANATSATLTLKAAATAGNDLHGYEIYGIPDGGADEAFDEALLTFDTFDYSSTTLDGSLNTSGLVLLVNSTDDDDDGASDEFYNFSSSALASFINNDTNDIVSLVVFQRTGQNGNASTFASSEATLNGPTLTVVPEPTLVAALLPCALLARRRRSI
jgi:hypothetical protein